MMEMSELLSHRWLGRMLGDPGNEFSVIMKNPDQCIASVYSEGVHV